MADNVTAFLDKMDSLRERQNQVDPRDVFMMEKIKLINENQLIIDTAKKPPSHDYCDRWLQSRKQDKKIKALIDEYFIDDSPPQSW